MADLLSAQVVLIIFIVLIVGVIVLAWYLGPYYEKYDRGRLHTFIAILTGVGVLITALFYYNLVLLQNNQQKLIVIQETSRINDTVLNNILKEITTSVAVIPDFIISITPLNPIPQLPPREATPLTAQEFVTQLSLSYRIFSLWQDVVMTSDFTAHTSATYMTNFLQRANSRPLAAIWRDHKINFSTKTQELGDLLFAYGLPITIQTPEEYTRVSALLTKDPRYLKILK